MFDHTKATIASPTIVGVGASTGGLEAFKQLFAHMPLDGRLAFVLIQHLLTDNESLLAEVLAKLIPLPVLEATDGMPVQAGQVYVIPADATLTIAEGVLQVRQPAPPRPDRAPINAFFSSLAADQGERAIGIVLTGHGDDGALGLGAIKTAGGLTIVQADANGHPLPGMPANATAAGMVDLLLPIDEMAAHLLSYQDGRNAMQAHQDDADPAATLSSHLESITALLLAETGHDFTHYKKATLMRRIQHRMLVAEIASVRDYIAFLRQAADEPKRLFREILIGVTEFFRDPEAFEVVQSRAIPSLLSGKLPADVIRVWVPGCASGQEAYSLAILLRESMTGERQPKVQIFGTDIDDRAISIARAGRYTAPLAGLSEERTLRWFTRVGDEYFVNKDIREMCVFSVHSVIKDPPFSRIDLVSCRNLMIYLNDTLQNQLIETFHYALRLGGFLLLGPSESLSRHANLFAEIHKKYRFFQRREQPRSEPRNLLGSSLSGSTTRESQPPARIREIALEDRARDSLEKHLPAFMVLNMQHDVMRFGGGIGDYLAPSAGNASLNGFGLLRAGLRGPARAAVMKVFADGIGFAQNDLRLEIDGQQRLVRLIVEPLLDDRGTVEHCVVAFAELRRVTLGSARLAGGADGSEDLLRIAALEQELEATQLQLYTAAELHESVSAELKSANEEYQSINEELQSTNEELETSREEMQAINEEVQNVNAEISEKNEDLLLLNTELSSLLDSTQIATLFLDRHMCIENYTPSMTELFHLRDGDRGRPVREIAMRIDYPGLIADFQQVTEQGSLIERVLGTPAVPAAFLMRMRPVQRAGRVHGGVVLTFVDITILRAR